MVKRRKPIRFENAMFSPPISLKQQRKFLWLLRGGEARWTWKLDEVQLSEWCYWRIIVCNLRWMLYHSVQNIFRERQSYLLTADEMSVTSLYYLQERSTFEKTKTYIFSSAVYVWTKSCCKPWMMGQGQRMSMMQSFVNKKSTSNVVVV